MQNEQRQNAIESVEWQKKDAEMLKCKSKSMRDGVKPMYSITNYVNYSKNTTDTSKRKEYIDRRLKHGNRACGSLCLFRVAE